MVSGIRVNACVQVTDEKCGLRVRLFELSDDGQPGAVVAEAVCGTDAIALRSIVRQLAEHGLRRAEHFRNVCKVQTNAKRVDDNNKRTAESIGIV